MVHNVIILILLIVVLIFFIGLIIFIDYYCIQYLCTAKPLTNKEKAKKIAGLAQIRKIRARHIQNVK